MLCWPRFYFCVACLKASQRNQGSDMWLKAVDLQIDVGTLTPTSRENQHSSVSKLWNNRRKQWRRHSPRRSRHTSSYFFPLNVHYQHCNLSVRQLCCGVVCVCVCVCVWADSRRRSMFLWLAEDPQLTNDLLSVWRHSSHSVGVYANTAIYPWEMWSEGRGQIISCHSRAHILSFRRIIFGFSG